MGSQLEIGEFG